MPLWKISIAFPWILLFGCTTSHYRVSKIEGLQVELSVTPDRIVLTCEKFSDEHDLRTFLINVLDEEKTVLTVIQSNYLDNDDCLTRIKKIQKILDTGKNIYIAGIGSTTEPRILGEGSYYFPAHGAYRYNGRGLQFMFIANEKGDCYGAFTGSTKPCPTDGFPIKATTGPK